MRRDETCGWMECGVKRQASECCVEQMGRDEVVQAERYNDEMGATRYSRVGMRVFDTGMPETRWRRDDDRTRCVPDVSCWQSSTGPSLASAGHWKSRYAGKVSAILVVQIREVVRFGRYVRLARVFLDSLAGGAIAAFLAGGASSMTCNAFFAGFLTRPLVRTAAFSDSASVSLPFSTALPLPLPSASAESGSTAVSPAEPASLTAVLEPEELEDDLARVMGGRGASSETSAGTDEIGDSVSGRDASSVIGVDASEAAAVGSFLLACLTERRVGSGDGTAKAARVCRRLADESTSIELSGGSSTFKSSSFAVFSMGLSSDVAFATGMASNCGSGSAASSTCAASFSFSFSAAFVVLVRFRGRSPTSGAVGAAPAVDAAAGP